MSFFKYNPNNQISLAHTKPGIGRTCTALSDTRILFFAQPFRLQNGRNFRMLLVFTLRGQYRESAQTSADRSFTVFVYCVLLCIHLLTKYVPVRRIRPMTRIRLHQEALRISKQRTLIHI